MVARSLSTSTNRSSYCCALSMVTSSAAGSSWSSSWLASDGPESRWLRRPCRWARSASASSFLVLPEWVGPENTVRLPSRRRSRCSRYRSLIMGSSLAEAGSGLAELHLGLFDQAGVGQQIRAGHRQRLGGVDYRLVTAQRAGGLQKAR